MDKRWKNAVIAVLAVVLTGAVVWGVVENVRHRRYRMQLQAMYERSFFQLVGEMDDLEVKLGKLTVSDGAKQDVILLSEVYRQADGAGRELASLPGSHQSMEEVLAFVNRLSEFSGALAQKVAKGESISKEDEDQLESLLERCRALNYAVQGLSAQDVANVALSAQPAQPDEEGDPYAEFAKPSTPVPSLIYDGAFSQAARTPPKALGTQSVDEDAALEIAKAYVGPERIESIAPEQGAKRGHNSVFVIQMDGTRVAHLGDIGCIPDHNVLGALQKVDVLLLPVGGNYTIDGEQAAELVKLIQPRTTIPMHYKTPGLTVAVSGAEDFLSRMGEGVERVSGSEIEITPMMPKVVVFEKPMGQE